MKFPETLIVIGITILLIDCFDPREALTALGIFTLFAGFLWVIIRELL